MGNELPQLIVADAAAWRTWLAGHHDDTAESTAKAMFDILTSQNRYAVLYRVDAAKRDVTRARRLEQYVAMLATGGSIYPQKRTRSS